MQLRATIALGFVALLTGGSASADIVLLRTDCGSPPAPGCFGTMADVLDDLFDPGRAAGPPSTANPVTVDIGPGEFALGASPAHPYCDGMSNLTFKGAGPRSTILTGGGYPGAFLDGLSYAVEIRDCTDVAFQDLTIRATGSTVPSGVRFLGNGSSLWTNTRIEAERIAWYDGPDESTHYWYSSELEIRPISSSIGFGAALYTFGGTHWFHGGQLVANQTAAAPTFINFGAVYANGDFDVHVYGSRLSSRTSAASTRAVAVWLGQVSFCGASGAFSAEGNAIEAVATGASSDAIGIRSCGAPVGVRGTRFKVEGTATVSRLRDDGSAAGLDAPYQLGVGDTPPAVSSAWSRKGQDTFRETDCSDTKCAAASLGAQTHELVFDPGCTGTTPDTGPWFDATVRKCRGL